MVLRSSLKEEKNHISYYLFSFLRWRIFSLLKEKKNCKHAQANTSLHVLYENRSLKKIQIST